MEQPKATIEPEIIINWAVERGGRPFRMKSLGSESAPGMIKIDFGTADEGLEEITWEEFMDIFSRKNLAFVYEEETSDGRISRFNRFVSRRVLFGF